MARAKYDPDTFPVLAEQYARNGLSDKQIADNLGISEASFYNYQKKHLEFLEAIKRGKIPANLHVENAMHKNAVGYRAEEIHTEFEYVHEVKDGKVTEQVKQVLKKKKIVLKEFRPSETAGIFWLTNRAPDRWKHIQKIELQGNLKSIAELVKEMKQEAEQNGITSD